MSRATTPRSWRRAAGSWNRVLTRSKLARISKLLDKVVARTRELPEDRQEELAEIMLEIAENPGEWKLTDEQLAEVELAKREVREGKTATEEEMAEVWRRFRR